MRVVSRTRRPDGAVVATYARPRWPGWIAARLRVAAQYLGLLPGWPEPDDP